MTEKDKPKIEVFYDEHDQKGGEFFERYKKESSPELILKSSREFRVSKNPEGEKMATFLVGFYYLEKGKKEKNQSEAGKLFLKAIKEFKKTDADKRVEKEAELLFLKTKMTDIDNGKADLKVISRRTELLKELGHKVQYHQEMALHQLITLTSNYSKLGTDEINKINESMLRHAQQAGDEDLQNKIKSLYHQIKAKNVHNDKIAADELNKAAEAVKMTSDKFGEAMIQTELMMAKAMTTPDPAKRGQLLAKVASDYEKNGHKMKANFVKSLLSPAPVKAATIVYLSDKSMEKLQELEKKIKEKAGEQSGPCAIFYHIGYAMERIKQIKMIMTRMAMARKEITELHIQENALRPKKDTPGKPISKRRGQIWRRIDTLREQMKLDMENLFIYGNLLLDQWSYVIGYIAGYEVPPTNSGWAPNFKGLLEKLQAKKYEGELSDFWSKHKKDIIWLNFHLRFYRNVFIEHLRKPWQMGNTMSVYGDEFSFHIPAAVGYVKPEDEKKILEEIYPLSPQRLRDMPDDYWEKKNLRRVLEVTLNYIDEIEEQADREKVWNAWEQLGGSTQSYDVIGLRLFNYISQSIETMIAFLDKNPSKLLLGEFKNDTKKH